MLRAIAALAVFALVANPLVAADATTVAIHGDYLETRTCDVYTGPCFANAEVGLTGNEAILAWHIRGGAHNEVDLTDKKVVLVVRASDTLGFGGGLVVNPDPIRSAILVDESATDDQQAALIDFVRTRASRVVGEVVRVESQPIDVAFDHIDMVAKLDVRNRVSVETRALRDSDCVCTNEEIYYPPLTDVENDSPAYTVEGRFSGRGLGTNWSHPDSRGSFLATFAY